MCLCVFHVSAGARGGQRRALGPEAEVTAGSELLDMSAGNPTRAAVLLSPEPLSPTL